MLLNPFGIHVGSDFMLFPNFAKIINLSSDVGDNAIFDVRMKTFVGL